jgi:hypothetical protein
MYGYQVNVCAEYQPKNINLVIRYTVFIFKLIFTVIYTLKNLICIS